MLESLIMQGDRQSPFGKVMEQVAVVSLPGPKIRAMAVNHGLPGGWSCLPFMNIHNLCIYIYLHLYINYIYIYTHHI